MSAGVSLGRVGGQNERRMPFFLSRLRRLSYIPAHSICELKQDREEVQNNMIQKSSLGTALSIAAGVSFYVLCMALSLVGPAGSRVPHAAENKATFVSVLLVTLVLSGASAYVSMQQRKAHGGALPKFPLGLSAACILILVISLFNGFAI